MVAAADIFTESAVQRALTAAQYWQVASWQAVGCCESTLLLHQLICGAPPVGCFSHIFKAGMTLKAKAGVTNTPRVSCAAHAEQQQQQKHSASQGSFLQTSFTIRQFAAVGCLSAS
jgi:hypothetical protein